MKFEINFDEHGYTGSVTINFPTRDQKTDILEKLRASGWNETGSSEDMTMEGKLQLARVMGEIVEERLETIDLTHIESGAKINSKELLSIYSDGNLISGLIGGWIIGGVPMGKLKS